MAPVPLRCYDAEIILKGHYPDHKLIKEVAKSSAAVSDQSDDVHATAAYKKAMIEVFVEKALTSALTRAKERARCDTRLS